VLFCAAYSGIANFSSLFNVLSLTRRIRAERNTGVPSRGLPLAVGAISPSVLSLAAVLALAVGVSFTFTNTADAWVAVAPRAPAAVPFSFRRPSRSRSGRCGCCLRRAPRALAVRGPIGISRRASLRIMRSPAYATSCVRTPGNYHWRRDCRYDSFGRRLCN
jgi:hypothetical protein